MAVSRLEAALSGIDWNKNVFTFLSGFRNKDTLEACNTRIAIWSRQFEIVDRENPALSFIREMQLSGHMVVALIALALYKPAAGAIRTMIETALYYTYFRTHIVELTTLQRDKNYYLSKKYILEYHKQHSLGFKAFQDYFGLTAQLEETYSYLSAIVHGQLPGNWTSTPLGKTSYSSDAAQEVAEKFVYSEEIVHKLFMCTLSPVMWDSFSTSAKKPLLKGLHGDAKKLLNLDER